MTYQVRHTRTVPFERLKIRSSFRRAYSQPKNGERVQPIVPRTFSRPFDPPQNVLPPAKVVVGWDTETLDGQFRMYADSTGFVYTGNSLPELVTELVRRKRHRSLNVAFNLRYDAQALMTLLSRDTQLDIHLLGEAYEDDLKIEYIPRKLLTITQNKRSIRFYDIYQFYFSSLDKASQKYLNRTKLEMSYDDLSRPEYWERNISKIAEYCVQDAVLTRDLGILAQDMYRKIGLDFSSPISTASLAEQFAIRYSTVPRYSFPQLQRAAYYSYGGGWFETHKRGYFEETTKTDIVSAYPAAMETLPDISAGTWKISEKRLPESDFGIALVRIRSLKGSIHHMPSLLKGLIVYPFSDWHYRYITLENADFLEYWELAEIEYVKVYSFYPDDDYRPFAYIRRLFDERARLKAVGDARQLALKILINSTYGKLIQNVEERDEKGVYKVGNLFLPIYASYITDRTRRQVFGRVLEEELDPIAFATDSILEEGKASGKGSGLGSWDVEKRGELIMVGTGVYEMFDGKSYDTHTRGFRLPKGQTLRETLENAGNKSSLEIQEVKPISLGQLYSFSKRFAQNRLNQWVSFGKRLSLNFDRKRKWQSQFQGARDVLKSVSTSSPLHF